jgi:shikimate kinase
MMKTNRLTATTPIFLIGFMGAGKSTVGEALAARLARPFIDLDKRIEAATERAIADLIAQEGEERFRLIESQLLQEAVRAPGAVIALGGGVVTRRENRQLIARTGLSFWLDVPFEVCWQRIQSDQTVRPLAPTEEAARERYTQRLPLYQQADFRIAVSGAQPASEVVEAILRHICKM